MSLSGYLEEKEKKAAQLAAGPLAPKPDAPPTPTPAAIPPQITGLFPANAAGAVAAPPWIRPVGATR